jgi:hypothetical protein
VSSCRATNAKAFATYQNSILRELECHAAYLNAISPFAPIVILARPDDYRRYFGFEG